MIELTDEALSLPWRKHEQLVGVQDVDDDEDVEQHQEEGVGAPPGAREQHFEGVQFVTVKISN